MTPAPRGSDETRTTTLDILWDAMWEDLRHNATGRPSGLTIIARHRQFIEEAVRLEAGFISKADPDTVSVPRADWEALRRVAKTVEAFETMDVDPKWSADLGRWNAERNRAWKEVQDALAALSSEPET